MHTTLAILTITASILFKPSIVHATPAAPLPAGQLITTDGSTPPGIPLSNGTTTSNLNAPGVPYTYNTCTVAADAPLLECLSALSQFPTGGDGEFHSYTPHDAQANYSLPQVRKSGQCRISVNLFTDASGAVMPTVWSWDGEAGLRNVAWGLLNECTKDGSVPVQGQVSGGVAILSLLQTIYPGFQIAVMKTAAIPIGEGSADVT